MQPPTELVNGTVSEGKLSAALSQLEPIPSDEDDLSYRSKCDYFCLLIVYVCSQYLIALQLISKHCYTLCSFVIFLAEKPFEQESQATPPRPLSPDVVVLEHPVMNLPT